MAGFAPFEMLVTYDLAEAIIIFLFSLLVAIMVNVFMKRIVSALTQKTKTTLDDDMVRAVKKPVFMGLLLFGLFLSLTSISYLEQHKILITKIATILGLIILFYLIHRILDALVKWYSSEWSVRIKGHESKQLSIFGKIADGVLVFIFVLILLRFLGIDITPLVASLGIGGLAVALALQETLSNFIAGLSIIGDKSLKVGDYVELENNQLAGYIDDISWRTSRIRTPGGDYIIVPNNKLSQSITKDYNFGSPVTSTGVTLYVSYKNDLNKVEQVANRVAKEVQDTVPGAVKGNEPKLRFKEFQESNIMATIYFQINSVTDQYVVKHEFIKRIKKEFEKNKIEISRPVRLVYMKK
jgi:small-conductance mechanosensitive channel